MRHSRIYVDTSVLGGCFDQEFKEWSNALVDDFRQGRLMPVLSDLLAAEIKDAPERVRDLHSELLALAGTGIQLSPEAIELTERYVAHGILPEAGYKPLAIHSPREIASDESQGQ